LVALTQIILIFRNVENSPPPPKFKEQICVQENEESFEIFRENIFYLKKWKLELLQRKDVC
jgi:hypothetical protein